jgi:hypothetical protein
VGPVRAVSVIFALLLCASLAAKVASSAGSASDERRLAADLGSRLRAHGFQASVEHRPTGLVIHGGRGACRLFVRNADDWMAAALMYRQAARSYGPLRYVYRRGFSTSPPRLGPPLDRATQRALGAIGIRSGRPALLALAATADCGSLDGLFDDIRVWRLSAR